MREQVASPVFPHSLERKKTSVKICERDENSEQRRLLNGRYVSILGEKPILNMPGGRVKGGTTSMDHVVEHDLAGLSLKKMNGYEKMETINGLEKMKEEIERERQKRRGSDDDFLLQWGHIKRPRCSRLEPTKLVTDESLILSKNTIRVERRVSKVEKQSGVGETDAAVVPSSRAQVLRPCPPALREVGSSSERRNGHLSESLKGVSTSNKSCTSNDARHLLPDDLAAERLDRHASPEKNGTLLTCPPTTDNGGSPDHTFASAAVNSGVHNTTMQKNPFAPEKVDLDSFEWPRILISLSRKEKEDDFMAIKGCKLPQRPKRRPKVVEKALHYCSPGNWLSDLTRGRYDVREKKSVKKKPRGLKAMESSDSDSE